MKNICEWDACKKIGEFKAPTQKDNNKKFRWLCKDHIKQFNSKWDYFEGMSQGQIEDFLKSDLTWHRPTQKFSSKDNFFNILWNNALSDKFKFFKDESADGINAIKLSEKDRIALKVLELDSNVDWTIVQNKFKTLVKKFHPDKNAGSRKFEDKLKKITLAYSHLKVAMMKK